MCFGLNIWCLHDSANVISGELTQSRRSPKVLLLNFILVLLSGLDHRRFRSSLSALYVRTVILVRPSLFVQWGPQTILIFGESVAQGVALYKCRARSRASLSASASPRPRGAQCGCNRCRALHFSMSITRNVIPHLVSPLSIICDAFCSVRGPLVRVPLRYIVYRHLDKNNIFSLIYLHIWKKSSTFVRFFT